MLFWVFLSTEKAISDFKKRYFAASSFLNKFLVIIKGYGYKRKYVSEGWELNPCCCDKFLSYQRRGYSSAGCVCFCICLLLYISHIHIVFALCLCAVFWPTEFSLKPFKTELPALSGNHNALRTALHTPDQLQSRGKVRIHKLSGWKHTNRSDSLTPALLLLLLAALYSELMGVCFNFYFVTRLSV